MRKPTICICENKDADQLRSNCEADQRLCFRYMDSTLPLLLKSEISSFQPASVTVQPNLCRTCLETTLLVFPRGGSNMIHVIFSLYQRQNCKGKNQHQKCSLQQVFQSVKNVQMKWQTVWILLRLFKNL